MARNRDNDAPEATPDAPDDTASDTASEATGDQNPDAAHPEDTGVENRELSSTWTPDMQENMEAGGPGSPGTGDEPTDDDGATFNDDGDLDADGIIADANRPEDLAPSTRHADALVSNSAGTKKDGDVPVYKRNDDGKEVIVAWVSPGEERALSAGEYMEEQGNTA